MDIDRYFEELHKGLCENGGCGGQMALIVVLLLFLLCGCKTVRTEEKTDTRDSVRIEYKEKIVKVPVTVYVEVPVEVKERFSNDSTSHLETSFAVSDASMVWIDGVAFLRHSLANKPQKARWRTSRRRWRRRTPFPLWRKRKLYGRQDVSPTRRRRYNMLLRNCRRGKN